MEGLAKGMGRVLLYLWGSNNRADSVRIWEDGLEEDVSSAVSDAFYLLASPYNVLFNQFKVALYPKETDVHRRKIDRDVRV